MVVIPDQPKWEDIGKRVAEVRVFKSESGFDLIKVKILNKEDCSELGLRDSVGHRRYLLSQKIVPLTPIPYSLLCVYDSLLPSSPNTEEDLPTLEVIVNKIGLKDVKNFPTSAISNSGFKLLYLGEGWRKGPQQRVKIYLKPKLAEVIL